MPANKKVIILIGSLCVLIVIIFAFLFFNTFSPQQTSHIPLPNTLSPTGKAESSTVPPTLQFDKFSLKNSAVLPHIPQFLNQYTVKTDFSKEDIAVLSRELGISSIQSTNDYYEGVNVSDPHSIGMFSFNRHNGSFEYKSYGNITAPGTSYQEQALNFLSILGVADATMSCPITYQKKGAIYNNVTFVECHRDWTKLGIADLNPIGVLNIPLGRSLSTLAVGSVSQDTPLDPSIINVQGTPDGNGKARLTDFNTATVALGPNGKVISVSSNLRWISHAEQIPEQQIKTPQQALDDFNGQKHDFALSIPDGTGNTDWQKVYQNNHAHALTATVTDITLAYTERSNDATQTTLSPQYLVRGYATLDNGYIVRFVETVDATLPKSQARLILQTQYVAGAQTQNSTPQPTDQLQLTTFTPQQPNYTAATPSGTLCDPQSKSPSLTTTLTVPNYGTVTIGAGAESPHAYFVSQSTKSLDIGLIRQAFFKAVEDQYVMMVARTFRERAHTYTSSDQVYTGFKNDMNEGLLDPYTHQPYNGCDGEINNEIAPVDYCDPSDPQDNAQGVKEHYQLDLAKQVANNVANRIYSAIQNNSVLRLGSQTDIFPASTLRNFHWVFIDESQSNQQGASSSCYVSGESPSLFFPNYNGTVTVSPLQNTTYSQPALDNNAWNVSVRDGVISKGEYSLNFLYYEYPETITLTHPSTGFVTSSEKLIATVDTIAHKFALTTIETKQLETEAQNALITAPKAQYIQISLADQAEVNTKLPLTISPHPQSVARIHLLLKPLTQSHTIQEPNIAPVVRSGFTVIEVGARVVNN